MAISAKVTDQLVTESGTTVTVMELSPFTHLENTEATIEAGIACQPYGVVMAPADASGETEVTFSQEGAESLSSNLGDLINTIPGDDVHLSGGAYIIKTDAHWITDKNKSIGTYEDSVEIRFGSTGGTPGGRGKFYIIDAPIDEPYPTSVNCKELGLQVARYIDVQVNKLDSQFAASGDTYVFSVSDNQDYPAVQINFTDVHATPVIMLKESYLGSIALVVK